MMTIEERLARREPEDIIYIGDVVEKAYLRGDFSKVLTALLNGRIMAELQRSKPGESPERLIGRLEAFAKITTDLEQFIVDRDQLRQERPKRGRKKKETFNASQPGESEE